MSYFLRLNLLFFSVVCSTAFAADLDLRDKIGQMLIVGFNGKQVNQQSTIVKQIETYNLGGVILFDYDPKTKQFDKNIESPTQVHQLNRDLQHYNDLGQEQQHRAHLPLIISVDYEGGMVNRLSADKGFPETHSAAEVGKMSVSDASVIANTMASTLKAAGFNLNFAPIMDLNTNPDNPIIGKKQRSFSAEPNVVSQYAHIFSNAYVQNNIQCAYKHFPGHGSSTGDSHLGFVDVTNTWQSKELEPYQNLNTEKQACGMIMTAHLVNRQLDESGLPATLSYRVLTELLREKLHFQGVIITDDMQMKAIADHYSLEQAVTLAINAGADMIIFGNQLSNEPQDPEDLIDLIEAKVHSGEISEQRINEAYQHIVALKQTIEVRL